MCSPVRKYDRIASVLLAAGLLLNFCALNFFPDHDAARGFLMGAGIGLELVALIRIAKNRRAS